MINKPSDLDKIINNKIGTYTKDGMEPIHQRHYNQGRDFNKLEYKYNTELNDVLDEIKNQGFEVELNHNRNDYDLYRISIIDNIGQAVICNDIEDVDDLLVELSGYKSSIAKKLINIINDIVD